MIQNLRKDEEVILYNNILKISEHQANEVISFLQKEYEIEALEYPYQAPNFDHDAALWAAKTIYIAAQLMLYRENKETDLGSLLPTYDQKITPGAMLSSDLCLRFLPDIIIELKCIDSEDVLIHILENMLIQWHYSGIHYPLDADVLDIKNTVTNDCLKQLYSNRIIKYKKIILAEHPVFKEWIASSLGMYASELWSDFKNLTKIDE